MVPCSLAGSLWLLSWSPTDQVARPSCRAFVCGVRFAHLQTIVAAKVSMGSQQLVTGTVSDSEGQEVKKARPYGKRNPDAVIEERRKRLYKRQLSGLTVRQLVLEHSDRESIAETTAWRDWEAVKQWNEADWEQDRQSVVSRLQGMRFRAIELALRKGQIGTAQLLMRDLGMVAGEVAPEAAAAAAPQLSITIDDKRQAE